MRRMVFLLVVMTLSLVVASGVAWAATITGTDQRDYIDGTQESDSIAGLGGNDLIAGEGLGTWRLYCPATTPLTVGRQRHYLGR